MTYRVSWDIDVNDAASPREAASKAHDMARRPGTSASVYNVEAPDGVVTVVDLDEVGNPRIAPPSPTLLQVLDSAERSSPDSWATRRRKASTGFLSKSEPP